MDAYTSFAQVYDLFMDNVPYESWCAYLSRVFASHGITDGAVLDLGCGTGRLTRLMAACGYDMIGVDHSVEMLSIARSQDAETDKILYLSQDMQKLELYGTVRAIYSACDCMNYVLEESGLRDVFARAVRYLEPKGLFVFDMNTPYKYRVLLQDRTFAENREEGSFIWENYFDEEALVNIYDLTLFLADGHGRYQKYEEEHYQRCYEIWQVQTMLEESGFTLLGIYNAYTDEPVQEDSERVLFVAERAVLQPPGMEAGKEK